MDATRRSCVSASVAKKRIIKVTLAINCGPDHTAYINMPNVAIYEHMYRQIATRLTTSQIIELDYLSGLVISQLKSDRELGEKLLSFLQG